MKEPEIYEHNKIINKTTIRSRFVCIHNDLFVRCFKDKNEILKYCHEFNDHNIEIKFRVTVISTNKENEINAFILDIFYKEIIEDIDSFAEEKSLYGLSNLDSCRYYQCTPCDYKDLNIKTKRSNLWNH